MPEINSQRIKRLWSQKSWAVSFCYISQLSEVKRGRCTLLEILPRKTKELKEMLLMELFHACPKPQQVFWDAALSEMSFLDGTLKQQIPEHLLSKSLWYFQQELRCPSHCPGWEPAHACPGGELLSLSLSLSIPFLPPVQRSSTETELCLRAGWIPRCGACVWFLFRCSVAERIINISKKHFVKPHSNPASFSSLNNTQDPLKNRFFGKNCPGLRFLSF